MNYLNYKTMKEINVRYFVYDYTTEDILIEVNEQDFMQYDGEIKYERNTIFENGVRQICLTKIS